MGVPVIFALNRRRLGRILKTHVRTSVVGIISYDGANDLFKVQRGNSRQLLSFSW